MRPSQISSSSDWSQRPLAVVGMACRLPGADGLSEFWQLLERGGYAIERMPDGKLDRELYFDPQKGQPGKTYSDVGGFVREREWDSSVLPIPRNELENWDECHLNLCEVTGRALLHAGYDPLALPFHEAAVFVGHSGGSTLGGELAFRTLIEQYTALIDQLNGLGEHPECDKIRDELCEKLKSTRPSRQHSKPFVEASCASGLISRAFQFTGPFMSIDAACASSLVALALGANALHAGHAKMAVVGGASYNKADSLILFSKAQSCSATASRPFDENADGLISSEGYVTVLVKTLDQAEADGDTIHAVIRGIGMSSDGRGRSLWAPRKEGQYAAIERAYSRQVTPGSVHMVEAHATSTQVGDATEMEALASFFGEHLPKGARVPVGSVKSNIGHTLETAGLAGLVKSILSIQNGIVPPTVNVKELNRSIEWDQINLYPVTSSEPWPKLAPQTPRRAAVNAFGIGGLNVHVVVDEYLPARQSAESHAVKVKRAKNEPGMAAQLEMVAQPEAIAVVGRGLVVPGAHSIQTYKELLQAPEAQFCIPPIGRQPCPGPYPVRSGFLVDFEYDWRKHRVPPKQIQQANPLQFMLLDAAEQALVESGLLSEDSHRTSTAVVVGSSFGGDFGNALFVGLRLPEIVQQLRDQLLKRDFAPEHVRQYLVEFQQRFREACPALEDETGSFTSSTLASRLSKTYDLMGGAMAIDAGDASGLAALNCAVNLLRSGEVSHVLCAAAQRALDPAAIENLWQAGRLKGSKGSNGQGYLVGEGVVLLALKRQADAEKAGDRVLATIHDVAGANSRLNTLDGFGQTNLVKNRNANSSRILGAVRLDELDREAQLNLQRGLGLDGVELLPSPNLDVCGHLQGAQGLLDVVHASFEPTGNSLIIADHATNGQCYTAHVTSGNFQVVKQKIERSSETMPKPAGQLSEPRLLPRQSPTSMQTIYFTAPTELEFRECLISSSSHRSEQAFAESFNANHWRAAIVCTFDELDGKLRLLREQVNAPAARVPLQEQGIFFRPPESRSNSNKVAWLFPGQGSQYAGMFEAWAQGPVVQAAIKDADKELEEIAGLSFAQAAWSTDSSLGQDVWRTQASMLVADYIQHRVLLSRGFQPDIVAGHSYGEFPALVASSALTLREALRATYRRCRSVESSASQGLAMLSIAADQEMVRERLDELGLSLAISHINAPQQTVVGGREAAVVRFEEVLSGNGVVARRLAVPTAFHTPYLAEASLPFREQLEEIPVQVPRLPLLSNVSNCYVADPELIKDALAEQLVKPLDFVGLVHRLIRDQVSLVVEVGPQQVLTKLIRQISADIDVVATDSRVHGTEVQMLRAQALMELHGCGTRVRSPQETRHVGPLQSEDSAVRNQPVHYDATVRRKSRMRARGTAGTTESIRPAGARKHYDATEDRRATRRQQAANDRPLGHAAENASETTRDQLQIDEPQSLASPHESTDFTGTRMTNGVGEEAAAATSGFTQIEQFLVDFVVEQTGYPAEIIELDWDIEADLGIDSIKKAQLFGELREFFDLESRDDIRLDAFRTLTDIVKLLEVTPGKGGWLDDIPRDSGASQSPDASGSTPADSIVNAGVGQLTAPVSESQAGSGGGLVPSNGDSEQDAVAEMTSFLVDFVVEQTGYPPEIVELDADLEADLGIDSIKKAQLLGEIREMFSIQVEVEIPRNVEGSVAFRTLREILDEVLRLTGSKAPSQQLAISNAEKANCEVANSGPKNSELVDNPAKALAGDGQGLLPGERENLPVLRFELPSASLGDSEQRVSSAYLKAVEANSTSLASLRDDVGSLPSVSANGHSNWYSERGALFASAFQITDRSLTALDRAIRAQVSWRMCSPMQRWERDRASREPGRFLCLADLQLPKWLMSSGRANLGVVHLTQGAGTQLHTEIGVPGTLVPLAVINDQRLWVASVSPAAPTSECLRLSRWMQTASRMSNRELRTEIKQLKFEMDFQVLMADAREARVTRIEAEAGSLMIQAESFLDIHGTETGPNSECGVRQIRLAYDRQEASFVAVSDEFGQGFQVAQLCAPESGTPDRIASRYQLRMVPSPARQNSGRQPEWFGAAMVVGDNPVATQLTARLRSAGVEVIQAASHADPQALSQEFEAEVARRPVPHLFLTTPLDEEAVVSLNWDCWKDRRERGILGNFWLCQKWMAHIIDQGLAHNASLIATASLGGDFGLSGKIRSIEGGALVGLLKSMVIEGWTQGYRPLTIKTIDTSAQESPAEIVGNIWRELAYPSYDMEISHARGIREVIRAFPANHSASASDKPAESRVTRGGVWVCTGGARGITAFVAEQLALRYDLQLHLIGKSPAPKVEPEWRELDERGLRELKAKIMTEARGQGFNPVKTWQNTEKALEIDATVSKLRNLGITAHYHSCDVSDRSALASVLEKVREISGPIQGVLHGAGVGKDSRFDRKQPEKVRECIAAKIDGAFSLMEATESDPLEYFIGFGSISGRFGANGHTDYSLANDALCKQLDWYADRRPETRAIAFHWHAWGDVGMATKPETKLALEMIDMQFMPAQEGLEHLIQEMESDGKDTEVLITDDRYFRTFFPAESLVTDAIGSSSAPADCDDMALLDSEIEPVCGGDRAFAVSLDPIKDPFLVEHRLDGRPLLPFVVGAEMLLEAAALELGTTEIILEEIEARGALRFFADQTHQARVETRSSERLQCQLFSDFISRNGRVVDKDRLHFQGFARKLAHDLTPQVALHSAGSDCWQDAQYPAEGSPFFVGWSLQRLRSLQLAEQEPAIIGRVSAPALIELAGGRRRVENWRIPSAALDACLFAVGVLAWQKVAPGTALPVSFGRLEFGRLPEPGEACEVHALLKRTAPGSAAFDFTLVGVDGSVLVNAIDYQVNWLTNMQAGDETGVMGSVGPTDLLESDHQG